MPKRVITYSDLSDDQLADNEIVAVTVKEAGKRFECSAEEFKKFKPVTNVYELDVVYPGGQRETVLVSRTEFNKLISEEKLASFPSNRGRQPGFSPKLNRSSTNGASAPAASE